MVARALADTAASAAGGVDESEDKANELAKRIAAGEFSSVSPLVTFFKPLRKQLAQMGAPGAPRAKPPCTFWAPVRRAPRAAQRLPGRRCGPHTGPRSDAPPLSPALVCVPMLTRAAGRAGRGMALALARFSREKLREMPEATGDIREIVGQVRGALAPRRSARQPPRWLRNPRATRAPRLRLAGASAAPLGPRAARRCGPHVLRGAAEAAAQRTRQTVVGWPADSAAVAAFAATHPNAPRRSPSSCRSTTSSSSTARRVGGARGPRARAAQRNPRPRHHALSDSVFAPGIPPLFRAQVLRGGLRPGVHQGHPADQRQELQQGAAGRDFGLCDGPGLDPRGWRALAHPPARHPAEPAQALRGGHAGHVRRLRPARLRQAGGGCGGRQDCGDGKLLLSPGAGHHRQGCVQLQLRRADPRRPRHRGGVHGAARG